MSYTLERNVHINKLLKDVISDGCKWYEDIDDITKDKLSILCMNALDTEAYSFIGETQEFEKVIDTLKDFILSDDVDDALDLARIMKEGVASKTQYLLSDLFEQLLADHQAEVNFEAGLKKRTCEQTGEVTWER